MPQNLFSTGAIVYSEERRKKQERYQEAVQRAGFLSEREKENWRILTYILDDQQLLEAEKAIINEDLRRLETRHKLEKIKPIIKKHGDS